MKKHLAILLLITILIPVFSPAPKVVEGSAVPIIDFVTKVGWWLYGTNNGIEHSEPIAQALENSVKTAIDNAVSAPGLIYSWMKSMIETRNGETWALTNQIDALTLQQEFKEQYEGMADDNPFPSTHDGTENFNISPGTNKWYGVSDGVGYTGGWQTGYHITIAPDSWRSKKITINGSQKDHFYVFRDLTNTIIGDYKTTIMYSIVTQDGQVISVNGTNDNFFVWAKLNSIDYDVWISRGADTVAGPIKVMLGSEWVVRDYSVVVADDSPVVDDSVPWSYNGINFADILSGQGATIDEIMQRMETDSILQQAILDRLESYNPEINYTGTAPVVNPITGQLEYPAVSDVPIDNTWGVGKILERIWQGLQAIPGQIASIFIPANGIDIPATLEPLQMSIAGKFPWLPASIESLKLIYEEPFEDIYVDLVFPIPGRYKVIEYTWLTSLKESIKSIIRAFLWILIVLYNINMVYKLIRGGDILKDYHNSIQPTAGNSSHTIMMSEMLHGWKKNKNDEIF